MEETLQSSKELHHHNPGTVSEYYIYTVRMGGSVETTHSESCSVVTGYTIQEFADDPYLWMRMVIEEDLDLVRQQVEHIYSGLYPQPIQHRITKKDGVVRWVESIVLPYRDEEGNLNSYDGIIWDITEHKNSSDSLRESEERFRFAATMVTDIIYDFDVESETMHWFGDVNACLGYADGKFPNTLKDWMESIHPDDILKVMTTYIKCY